MRIPITPSPKSAAKANWFLAVLGAIVLVGITTLAGYGIYGFVENYNLLTPGTSSRIL
jgi:predicted phage tail protein